MFMVLHDLLVLGDTLDAVSVTKAAEFWDKVPQKRIDEPPKAGSRAFQMEIHDKFMRAAVGSNYRGQIEAKLAEAKELLRAQKALV